MGAFSQGEYVVEVKYTYKTDSLLDVLTTVILLPGRKPNEKKIAQTIEKMKRQRYRLRDRYDDPVNKKTTLVFKLKA